MGEVTTIGLDIAKQVFHAHSADEKGAMVFSRRVSFRVTATVRGGDGGVRRSASLGRELHRLGHEMPLIPLAYVKPFVKRQRNDAADTEAICEAAQRPTMRFATVKSERQQASAAVFRARDLFVRQRTHFSRAGLLSQPLRAALRIRRVGEPFSSGHRGGQRLLWPLSIGS